jgi:hypothetical protein
VPDHGLPTDHDHRCEIPFDQFHLEKVLGHDLTEGWGAEAQALECCQSHQKLEHLSPQGCDPAEILHLIEILKFVIMIEKIVLHTFFMFNNIIDHPVLSIVQYMNG